MTDNSETKDVQLSLKKRYLSRLTQADGSTFLFMRHPTNRSVYILPETLPKMEETSKTRRLIVLAVDHSGSMSNARIGAVREVLNEYADRLKTVDPDARFLFIPWSDTSSTVLCGPNELKTNMSARQPSGMTYPRLAFERLSRWIDENLTKEHLEQLEIKLLFLTDGEFTEALQTSTIHSLLERLEQCKYHDLVYVGVEGDVPKDAEPILRQFKCSSFLPYNRVNDMKNDSSLLSRLDSKVEIRTVSLALYSNTPILNIPIEGHLVLEDEQECDLLTDTWFDAHTKPVLDMEQTLLDDRIFFETPALVREEKEWVETKLLSSSSKQRLEHVQDLQRRVKRLETQFQSGSWKRSDPRIAPAVRLLRRLGRVRKQVELAVGKAETSFSSNDPQQQQQQQRQRFLLTVMSDLRSAEHGDRVASYIGRNICINMSKTMFKPVSWKVEEQVDGSELLTYTWPNQSTSKQVVPLSYLKKDSADPISQEQLSTLYRSGHVPMATFFMNLSQRTQEELDGCILSEADLFHLYRLFWIAPLSMTPLVVSSDTMTLFMNRVVDRRAMFREGLVGISSTSRFNLPLMLYAPGWEANIYNAAQLVGWVLTGHEFGYPQRWIEIYLPCLEAILDRSSASGSLSEFELRQFLLLALAYIKLKEKLKIGTREQPRSSPLWTPKANMDAIWEGHVGSSVYASWYEPFLYYLMSGSGSDSTTDRQSRLDTLTRYVGWMYANVMSRSNTSSTIRLDASLDWKHPILQDESKQSLVLPSHVQRQLCAWTKLCNTLTVDDLKWMEANFDLPDSFLARYKGAESIPLTSSSLDVWNLYIYSIAPPTHDESSTSTVSSASMSSVSSCSSLPSLSETKTTLKGRLEEMEAKGQAIWKKKLEWAQEKKKEHQEREDMFKKRAETFHAGNLGLPCVFTPSLQAWIRELRDQKDNMDLDAFSSALRTRFGYFVQHLQTVQSVTWKEEKKQTQEVDRCLAAMYKRIVERQKPLEFTATGLPKGMCAEPTCSQFMEDQDLRQHQLNYGVQDMERGHVYRRWIPNLHNKAKTLAEQKDATIDTYRTAMQQHCLLHVHPTFYETLKPFVDDLFSVYRSEKISPSNSN